eukprot:GHVR01113568.1.p1 GENE.GHVR01113568.1~~GHVR01113568.1.p1  ORF type:complete len:126 (+),score=2.36 GHVR01113568.1:332-709(+)
MIHAKISHFRSYIGHYRINGILRIQIEQDAAGFLLITYKDIKYCLRNWYNNKLWFLLLKGKIVTKEDRQINGMLKDWMIWEWNSINNIRVLRIFYIKLRNDDLNLREELIEGVYTLLMQNGQPTK